MSVASVRMDVAPVPRMLFMQIKSLLMTYIRIPAFSVTSLALPLMFWLFFGLPNAHQTMQGGINAGAYVLCSFAAYAVSSMMVFNFGIGVANARGQKTDLLQRATPLPSWISIAATIVNALIFALTSVLLLILFAGVTGGVWLNAGTYLSLIGRVLLGSLPMIALGMAIGYSAGPNAAPAITNLIYLPMAFASGLFVPAQFLPDIVQKVTVYLPLYHYGQLAWDTIGGASEPIWKAILGLVIWAIILFAVAIRAFRLDQTRKFA
jgi:ABC-2 type transport system permease protein